MGVSLNKHGQTPQPRNPYEARPYVETDPAPVFTPPELASPSCLTYDLSTGCDDTDRSSAPWQVQPRLKPVTDPAELPWDFDAIPATDSDTASLSTECRAKIAELFERTRTLEPDVFFSLADEVQQIASQFGITQLDVHRYLMAMLVTLTPMPILLLPLPRLSFEVPGCIAPVRRPSGRHDLSPNLGALLNSVTGTANYPVRSLDELSLRRSKRQALPPLTPSPYASMSAMAGFLNQNPTRLPIDPDAGSKLIDRLLTQNSDSAIADPNSDQPVD